jgi:hypothetical protein
LTTHDRDWRPEPWLPVPSIFEKGVDCMNRRSVAVAALAALLLSILAAGALAESLGAEFRVRPFG